MTDLRNVGTITTQTRHSEEYFNRTCYATIPESWEAELTLNDKILDLLDANNDYTHLRIYGSSQDSEQDAVDDLISQLKELKLTGTLKVVSL